MIHSYVQTLCFVTIPTTWPTSQPATAAFVGPYLIHGMPPLLAAHLFSSGLSCPVSLILCLSNNPYMAGTLPSDAFEDLSPSNLGLVDRDGKAPA